MDIEKLKEQIQEAFDKERAEQERELNEAAKWYCRFEVSSVE